MIETERIKFERHYEYRQDELLDFVTKLCVKTEGLTIDNRVPLYPIRKKSLARLLHRAGFQDIKFYGGFQWEPLSSLSMPLVVSVRKKAD